MPLGIFHFYLWTGLTIFNIVSLWWLIFYVNLAWPQHPETWSTLSRSTLPTPLMAPATHSQVGCTHAAGELRKPHLCASDLSLDWDWHIYKLLYGHREFPRIFQHLIERHNFFLRENTDKAMNDISLEISLLSPHPQPLICDSLVQRHDLNDNHLSSKRLVLL